MDSIGTILKSERETRGLSLEEVHDATRITVQNLSALEEDRFDSFPNRVYARAFLRDYANFLGLDSGGLLDRYEEEWNIAPQTEAASRAGGSAWRVLGWLVFSLLVAGILAGGLYLGWRYYERQHKLAVRPTTSARRSPKAGATLPPVERVVPPKPKPPAATTTPGTAPAKPTQPATPEKPTPPRVTDKLVLEVTATRDVWVGITSDGKKVFQNVITAGTTQPFEATSEIKIRAGMAGAVQVKLNGKPQPSLGSLKDVGEATYKLPKPPATPPQ